MVTEQQQFFIDHFPGKWSKEFKNLSRLLVQYPEMLRFYLLLHKIMTTGRWVFFIGAGVSVESGLPPMKEVMNKMALCTGYNNLSSYEEIYNKLHENPIAFQSFCRWVQMRFDSIPSYAHAILASIWMMQYSRLKSTNGAMSFPQRTIDLVTTNWDLLIENTVIGRAPWTLDNKMDRDETLGAVTRDLETKLMHYLNRIKQKDLENLVECLITPYSNLGHAIVEQRVNMFAGRDGKVDLAFISDSRDLLWFNKNKKYITVNENNKYIRPIYKIHGSPFYLQCPICHGPTRWVQSELNLTECKVHNSPLSYRFLVEEKVDVIDLKLLEHVSHIMQKADVIFVIGYSGNDLYLQDLISNYPSKSIVVSPHAKTPERWTRIPEENKFNLDAFQVAILFTHVIRSYDYLVGELGYFGGEGG